MKSPHSQKPADVPVLTVPHVFAAEGMAPRHLASVGDFSLILKPDANAREVIDRAAAEATEHAREQLRELFDRLQQEGKPLEAKRLADSLKQTREALQAVEDEQADAERQWKVLIDSGADPDAVNAVDVKRRELATRASFLEPRVQALQESESKARRAAVMEMRAALQQRLMEIQKEASDLHEVLLAVAMPRLLPALIADCTLVGLRVEHLIREMAH